MTSPAPRHRHPRHHRRDAGSYPLTAGGLSSGNYAIGYAPGTLTIDPAALTVTASDAARRYGAADPDFTARYRRLRARPGPGDLAGSLAITTPATPASGAAATRSPPRGLLAATTPSPTAPGTLTIDPAALTITAGERPAAYGTATARLHRGLTTASCSARAQRSRRQRSPSPPPPATRASDAGSYSS